MSLLAEEKNSNLTESENQDGKTETGSTQRETPSIEVLKTIFEEIDINKDETLQKSELKKAAMVGNTGSLISRFLPPKVFLSQCEKIYSDKLSNAEDGINFDMFCKLFFQERKKLDAAEAHRLGESFLDAAYNDNIIFLKHIYNQGCNVEYKDRGGRNALLIASRMSHTEICTYLIKVAKVDVNVSNKKDGHTALHHVCENGNVDIVKLLIKYDARINVKEKYDGKSPLECAAYNGYFEIARYLIACGAKVDSRNRNGSTPLISAAYGGHRKVVKLLLKK